jgi:two-component system sensor histidine kinase YcbA
LRQRNEEMLLFISDLYEETIQLQSSLQHIEDITHSAYILYDYLKHKDERADEALRLVGQIHEIKKNNQRIYAGLKKLIDQEKNFGYLNMKELCELVVRSNEKYAGMLGKQIHFVLDVQPDRYEVHAFTLLSVINNLVVNAVEAIKETGTITLKVYRRDGQVHISVIDDGPGIPPAKKAVIFNPGYTNKFDHSGKPSTGIGLTYVKQLVESLGGSIAVESNGNNQGAQFLVKLPLKTISTSEGREEQR